MKMNKIIIPAAMLAVGVALVGSVSSTLAWYQYSTKAQAAYIGTSVGVSEGLEIKTGSGQNEKWKTNLTTSDVDNLSTVPVAQQKLIPITTGGLGANETLPLDTNEDPIFYSAIQTGFDGYGDQDDERYAEEKNYVQFTLHIRYKKTDSTGSSYQRKSLRLIDLTIKDEEDLSSAIRVHFAAAEQTPKYNLFAKGTSSAANVVTNTYGNLDTDNDGVLDQKMDYEFNYDSQNPLPLAMYGVEDSTQTALNANVQNLNREIGILPEDNANGLAVTVTIWIEGWQKLSGIPQNNKDTGTSAMWDPAIYDTAVFNVGMRFQAVDVQ